jgi:hypothetical protein
MYARHDQYHSCGWDVPSKTPSSAKKRCPMQVADIDTDPDDTWLSGLVLVGLFVFFRLFALYILQQKATKFF